MFITDKNVVCNALKIKVIPFSLQKTAYWTLKGGVLEGERSPLGKQSAAARHFTGMHKDILLWLQKGRQQHIKHAAEHKKAPFSWFFSKNSVPLHQQKQKRRAPVAKLVDAPDLGSGVLRRVGSSPIRRTINGRKITFDFPPI